MPITTAKIYPSAIRDMFNGTLTTAQSYKIALLNSSGGYSGLHQVWNDIYGSEVQGAGYTSGGVSANISTATSNETSVTFNLSISANWSFITTTSQVANAILYSTTSNRLLMHIEMTPETLTNKNFTISIPTGPTLQLNY